MKVPSYSRYDYCVECACNFLEDHNINSYPLELISIIENSPYALVPYSELMEVFHCTLEVVCKTLKSNEGRTVYKDGIYTIAYNDVNKSDGRILFTLAHELGHIYLNHMLDFEITEMPKESNEIEMPRYEYDILEREANAFARNILVPIPLYYFLKEKSAYNLQKRFGITYEAAIARQHLIGKDYACSRNLGLYPRFIEIFSHFMDKKKCSVCGIGLIQKHGKYCPICGSKNTLQWGDGKMKYENWDVNANGRIKECLKCHNEDLIGTFCQICGSPVENKCTNSLYNNDYDSCLNDANLPANARFCHMCGSESLFMRRQLLDTWQEELKKLEEQEKLQSGIGFMNIPDGIEDEGLPFN